MQFKKRISKQSRHYSLCSLATEACWRPVVGANALAKQRREPSNALITFAQ